ncbi:MAG TPA: S8 family serine peptidase [Acidimicrobiia bacterium]|nr:S8 family serine peptidase [Acidimicrobiia bacterium]
MPSGPWQDRVEFGPGGAFAYRPGQLVVRSEFVEQAVEVLAANDMEVEQEAVAGNFERLSGDFEVREALGHVHNQGVLAQVNHVLFATSGCCPPHPSAAGAADFYSEAKTVQPSGVGANPFYANPFYANPFYANPWGGCSCGCGCGGSSANPFYANLFYANPFYANPEQNPGRTPAAATGRRRSSARPAAPPKGTPDTGEISGVRVTILDTGWADSAHAPSGVAPAAVSGEDDFPDGDGDQFLDPAAGHGTFITGLISRLAPGCHLELIQVLSGYGDGDEVEIANKLIDLSQRGEGERPHIVNLSFGGYSPLGMGVLYQAVTALTAVGTLVVASAGNDGTCVPMYPAALPKVVAVGALDDAGKPAVFTNYGPWVDASAAGVDVISTFFRAFDGAEPAVKGEDADAFDGWACWSGTSFAAPRVAAQLAHLIAAGRSPTDARTELLDGQNGKHHPALGTLL